MIYQVTELLSVKAGFEPSFNFEVSTLLRLASMLNPVLWKRKPDDFESLFDKEGNGSFCIHGLILWTEFMLFFFH